MWQQVLSLWLIQHQLIIRSCVKIFIGIGKIIQWIIHIFNLWLSYEIIIDINIIITSSILTMRKLTLKVLMNGLVTSKLNIVVFMECKMIIFLVGVMYVEWWLINVLIFIQEVVWRNLCKRKGQDPMIVLMSMMSRAHVPTGSGMFII